MAHVTFTKPGDIITITTNSEGNVIPKPKKEERVKVYTKDYIVDYVYPNFVSCFEIGNTHRTTTFSYGDLAIAGYEGR